MDDTNTMDGLSCGQQLDRKRQRDTSEDRDSEDDTRRHKVSVVSSSPTARNNINLTPGTHSNGDPEVDGPSKDHSTPSTSQANSMDSDEPWQTVMSKQAKKSSTRTKTKNPPQAGTNPSNQNSTSAKRSRNRAAYHIVLKFKYSVSQNEIRAVLKQAESPIVTKCIPKRDGRTYLLEFADPQSVNKFHALKPKLERLTANLTHANDPENENKITIEAFEQNYKPPTPPEPTVKKDNLTCVVVGVDPRTTDAELTEDIQNSKYSTKITRHHRVVSRSSDKPTGLIRLWLTDEETQNELIQNGIVLGIIQYKVEASRNAERVPLCTKCKSPYHSKDKCTANRYVCGLCDNSNDNGVEHTEDQCPNTEKGSKTGIKCHNCGGNHTAWFRGCPVLLLARKDQVKQQTETKKQENDKKKAQAEENKQTKKIIKQCLNETKYSYAKAVVQSLSEENVTTTPIMPESIKESFASELKSAVDEIKNSFQEELKEIMALHLENLKRELTAMKDQAVQQLREAMGASKKATLDEIRKELESQSKNMTENMIKQTELLDKELRRNSSKLELINHKMKAQPGAPGSGPPKAIKKP